MLTARIWSFCLVIVHCTHGRSTEGCRTPLRWRLLPKQTAASSQQRADEVDPQLPLWRRFRKSRTTVRRRRATMETLPLVSRSFA